MKVEFNDFRRQWEAQRTSFAAALERVGSSGWLVLGNEVKAFEAELANAWPAKFAIGTGNGLDALEIALRILGVGQGDYVLTTPLSAFATTLAIVRIGARPVFVDVDATGLLDLNRAADACRANPKIRHIVPVHLFGHAINLEDLAALCKQFDLVALEDCAQSIGARSAGKAVGSASPVCATSFYPTKNLGALGDGGAILTDREDIAVESRALRDYGQTSKYVHDKLGMNSRLDELQAAFLRAQLAVLAQATERRRAIAQRYGEQIESAAVVTPPRPAGSESVWHLYPVLTPSPTKLAAHLSQAGISTARHYPHLINTQKALEGAAIEVPMPVTMAEKFANQELSLPIHPYMTDDDVDHVVKAVNGYRDER